MLDFSRTQVLESRDFNVQTGYTITAEGAAISTDYTTTGTIGVRNAAGDSSDTYLGTSISQQLTLLEFPEIINIVSSGTYTVPHTPIGGSILVYNETAGSAITFNAAAGAGQYNLVGNTFTFNVAQAGQSIRIQYRYTPSTLEALTIQGDIPPGGAANLILGTMGVILKGQVATSVYDTTANWQVAAPVLKLSAGGRYTQGGSGIAVPGAVIISVPTSSDPYLVFEV